MSNPDIIHLARRVAEVTPFLAMEIMERAKQLEAEGRDIIYLCLGEPDFPTPDVAKAAAIACMEANEIRYTVEASRGSAQKR